MNKTLASLIFILINQWSFAGGGNEIQGAKAVAMAGASVTSVNVWSTSNNPGALGLVDRISIGGAFQSRFFLPEAGLKSIAAVAPLGGGSIGLRAHSFGYAGYSDNQVALTYARKLSDYFSLGAQIDYVQVSIGDVYGSRSTFVGEVGVLVMPSDKLRFGAHVFNPTRTQLADFDDERIATVLRLGGQYVFSERLTAVVELDKNIALPINIKTGLQYSPVQSFFIRGGFATLQNTLAFGIGYEWKDFQIDLSSSWNQNLGYSSAVSLAYQFGNRKK